MMLLLITLLKTRDNTSLTISPFKLGLSFFLHLTPSHHLYCSFHFLSFIHDCRQCTKVGYMSFISTLHLYFCRRECGCRTMTVRSPVTGLSMELFIGVWRRWVGLPSLFSHGTRVARQAVHRGAPRHVPPLLFMFSPPLRARRPSSRHTERAMPALA